ncbi:MAG TPA: hypothetical protein VGJ83_01030 [Gemmatimonadales bacterium]|jgi:hypothetical protein
MKSFILAIIVCTVAACGGGSDGSQASARDSLTERQRDSILAKAKIPGASGVGRAMTAADSTSARIQQANTVAADTTPQ